MARLCYIFLFAFLLPCCEGEHLAEYGNSIEDVPVLWSVETARERNRLPYIRYGIGETENDSIVELMFLYVEEHNGGIMWEEGAVRIPQATLLRYNVMPVLRHGPEYGY